MLADPVSHGTSVKQKANAARRVHAVQEDAKVQCDAQQGFLSVTGLKDASEYPNLIYELLKRGYSASDIKKICHENVFRVWNEVLNIAETL